MIAAAALALTGAARASTYKIIHQFEIPQTPLGHLTMDAAGNLYGTTEFGGSRFNKGVVWKLAPNGILTMLHKFTGGADGSHPRAGLTFDAAGNLYGTAADGGASVACSKGCGTVFKLAPNRDGTWTESVLHSFAGPDGWSPQSGLIFDAGGNLYGTTDLGGGSSACPRRAGCGTVFKLTPNPDGTWTESVLYRFTGGADGANPDSDLTFDAGGNLYSTADDGGSCFGGCGVVFKLATNPDGTWTESVLYSFTGGTDGGYPVYSGVIFDAAGNLYGTTQSGGGPPGNGVVFKLAPNPDGTWTESVLHDFTGGADGDAPRGGVTLDAAGNVYGTTELGGSRSLGFGVVFKLTPTSTGWSETVLHTFRHAEFPEASMISDSKGDIYGTATGGGAGSGGVVFKITP
jgi:uncharacterized repeat protein (TIGR03803 family)